MDAQVSKMAVVGDCHGHLQLALCVLAQWQQKENVRFEAVFLCGDVGTFTEEGQLDSATRRHARTNPCELEFLTQWSSSPPAPWLSLIFKPIDQGGLGLTCPVVMVHGNHEGFAHLEKLVPPGFPGVPVEITALPSVVPGGHIRLLPSGWQAVTTSGHLIAGIGGMEKGQRQARYHSMAYIDEDAVEHLLGQKKAHILLTHQGPSGIQGDHGSPTLQLLLDEGMASIWFHGHSTPLPNPVHAGKNGATMIVPLGDIAFPGSGPELHEPGKDGWAIVSLKRDNISAEKKTPTFLRDFRQTKWTRINDGRLICPPLAELAWSMGIGT